MKSIHTLYTATETNNDLKENTKNHSRASDKMDDDNNKANNSSSGNNEGHEKKDDKDDKDVYIRTQDDNNDNEDDKIDKDVVRTQDEMSNSPNPFMLCRQNGGIIGTDGDVQNEADNVAAFALNTADAGTIINDPVDRAGASDGSDGVHPLDDLPSLNLTFGNDTPGEDTTPGSLDILSLTAPEKNKRPHLDEHENRIMMMNTPTALQHTLPTTQPPEEEAGGESPYSLKLDNSPSRVTPRLSPTQPTITGEKIGNEVEGEGGREGREFGECIREDEGAMSSNSSSDVPSETPMLLRDLNESATPECYTATMVSHPASMDIGEAPGGRGEDRTSFAPTQADDNRASFSSSKEDEEKEGCNPFARADSGDNLPATLPLEEDEDEGNENVTNEISNSTSAIDDKQQHVSSSSPADEKKDSWNKQEKMDTSCAPTQVDNNSPQTSATATPRPTAPDNNPTGGATPLQGVTDLGSACAWEGLPRLLASHPLQGFLPRSGLSADRSQPTSPRSTRSNQSFSSLRHHEPPSMMPPARKSNDGRTLIPTDLTPDLPQSLPPDERVLNPAIPTFARNEGIVLSPTLSAAAPCENVESTRDDDKKDDDKEEKDKEEEEGIKDKERTSTVLSQPNEQCTLTRVHDGAETTTSKWAPKGESQDSSCIGPRGTPDGITQIIPSQSAFMKKEQTSPRLEQDSGKEIGEAEAEQSSHSRREPTPTIIPPTTASSQVSAGEEIQATVPVPPTTSVSSPVSAAEERQATVSPPLPRASSLTVNSECGDGADAAQERREKEREEEREAEREEPDPREEREEADIAGGMKQVIEHEEKEVEANGEKGENMNVDEEGESSPVFPRVPGNNDDEPLCSSPVRHTPARVSQEVEDLFSVSPLRGGEKTPTKNTTTPSVDARGSPRRIPASQRSSSRMDPKEEPFSIDSPLTPYSIRVEKKHAPKSTAGSTPGSRTPRSEAPPSPSFSDMSPGTRDSLFGPGNLSPSSPATTGGRRTPSNAAAASGGGNGTLTPLGATPTSNRRSCHSHTPLGATPTARSPTSSTFLSPPPNRTRRKGRLQTPMTEDSISPSMPGLCTPPAERYSSQVQVEDMPRLRTLRKDDSLPREDDFDLFATQAAPAHWDPEEEDGEAENATEATARPGRNGPQAVPPGWSDQCDQFATQMAPSDFDDERNPNAVSTQDANLWADMPTQRLNNSSSNNGNPSRSMEKSSSSSTQRSMPTILEISSSDGSYEDVFATQPMRRELPSDYDLDLYNSASSHVSNEDFEDMYATQACPAPTQGHDVSLPRSKRGRSSMGPPKSLPASKRRVITESMDQFETQPACSGDTSQVITELAVVVTSTPRVGGKITPSPSPTNGGGGSSNITPRCSTPNPSLSTMPSPVSSALCPFTPSPSASSTHDARGAAGGAKNNRRSSVASNASSNKRARKSVGSEKGGDMPLSLVPVNAQPYSFDWDSLEFTLPTRRIARKKSGTLSKPMTLLCTGLEAYQETQREFKEVFKKHGVSFTETWSNKVTHVVTTGPPLKRTLKLLCGICSGIPIISVTFLEQCLSRNELLPEAAFLFNELAPSLERARYARLLKDYKSVYIFPSVFKSVSERSKWSDVVDAAGSKLRSSFPRDSDSADVLIIGEPENKEYMKKRKMKTPIYAFEMIQSGFYYQRLEMERYRLDD